MYTVYGHKGFLGRNIVNYLKKRNKNIFLPQRNKYIFKRKLGNIIFCIGDDNWINDPILSFENNLNTVSLVLKNKNYKSFTFISTTRIYNLANKSNVSEINKILCDAYDKKNLFNLFKITAENLIINSASKKVKIIRISNLFGHSKDLIFDHKYKTLVPTIIRNIFLKKKIIFTINKKSSKDFLYINDALPYIFKIILKGKYNVYNLAYGKNISISSIGELIKKKFNLKVIYKIRSKFFFEPKINNNRLKKEFNFKPGTSFLNYINNLEKFI
jgi:nucleoside-diphosphate-sugar epimerase